MLTAALLKTPRSVRLAAVGEVPLVLFEDLPGGQWDESRSPISFGREEIFEDTFVKVLVDADPIVRPLGAEGAIMV